MHLWFAVDFCWCFTKVFVILSVEKSITKNQAMCMRCSFPDVMMPAYKLSRWWAAFYIVYISLELFLFMNLVSPKCFSEHVAYAKSSSQKIHKAEVTEDSHMASGSVC